MTHDLSQRTLASRRTRQAGVTLIELMVGLVVGLMAVLIITQVMLTSEGQKRSATGGADAQISGALALYAMQRDVEQAGYGIGNGNSIFSCPLSARFNNAVVPGFPARLDPVRITPQAARPAGSVGDSIRILGSSADSFAMPLRVLLPYAAINQQFSVQSTVGFRAGDLALVAKRDAGQPCSVFQVSAAPTVNGLPRADNSTWNAVGTPATSYGASDVVVNLGQLHDNIYEINNNVLQLSSFNAATPAVRQVRDLQPDIVQLRAYYGRDTAATSATDGTVDVFDTVTPTTAADWDHVLSVRIIAVARSSAWEKSEQRSDGTTWYPTSENPRWSVGASPATQAADLVACPGGGANNTCIELDVGAGVAGDVPAKHYRYKVFETIVPLRNILWRGT